MTTKPQAPTITPMEQPDYCPLESLFCEDEGYAVNFDCLGVVEIEQVPYVAYQHKLTNKIVYVAGDLPTIAAPGWDIDPGDCLIMLALAVPDGQPLYAIATAARARAYAEGEWNVTGIVF